MDWVFGLIMAIIAAVALGGCIRGYFIREPKDTNAYLIAATSVAIAAHVWAHLLGVYGN